GGNLCSGSSLQSIRDSAGIRPVDCGELGCHIFDSSIWLAWAYVNHGQLHVIARSLLKGLSKGSIIHIGDCAGRDHQYAHRAINISGAVSCGIGRCDNRWARLWLAARAKCLDGVGGFVTVAKARLARYPTVTPGVRGGGEVHRATALPSAPRACAVLAHAPVTWSNCRARPAEVSSKMRVSAEAAAGAGAFSEGVAGSELAASLSSDSAASEVSDVADSAEGATDSDSSAASSVSAGA